jgi:drug/metabolite transporter (DMT)-like permease
MIMIWGLVGIAASFLENVSVSIERKTLLKEHAMEFSASLVIFAMLFATPLWLFTNTAAIALNAVWLTFVSGLFFALSVFFFAKTLRHMATPYTNPFLSLTPVIIALFAWKMLGEELSLIKWVSVLLVSLGTYVLYAHSHKDIFDPVKKAVHIPHLKFVILGILTYAASAVMDKKLVGVLAMPWPAYTVLLMFFSGVVLIIMMLMFHDGFAGIGNGMKGNGRSLSILALMLLLSKGALAFALTFPGVLVSVLYSVKQVSLLFSTAASGDLFHKDHVLRKMLACLLIIAGAALLVF